MAKKETKPAKEKAKVSAEDRRNFVKKIGMGILVTSAYSLISMTQFGCKHEPLEPTKRGGY